MSENINDGGNITTTDVAKLKVEGEVLNVHYTGDGDDKQVAKIEFPEHRKDDVEWQQQATKAINLESLKYKNNMDRKRTLNETKETLKQVESAKNELKSILSPEKEVDFDLQGELYKELKIEGPADLADLGNDVIKKAQNKVAGKYQDLLKSTTTVAQANANLAETIVRENTPEKVKEFVSWSKNLGVKNITPQMYQVWKSQQQDTTPSKSPTADLANIQLENIPFVPVGSNAPVQGKAEKIHASNSNAMLKHIRKA